MKFRNNEESVLWATAYHTGASIFATRPEGMEVFTEDGEETHFLTEYAAAYGDAFLFDFRARFEGTGPDSKEPSDE
jgi:hypothetical protein